MKKLLSRLLSVYLVIALVFANIALAECAHDWDFEYDPVSNYEVANDTYHKIVSTTLYYVCSSCGDKKVETEIASTQYESKHKFNSNNVCNTCGYEREIEIHEHDWEFEYDPVDNYEPVNDTHHKIVSTTLYYICECGEKRQETQYADGSESKHNFNNNNVCGTCGYELIIEITPEPPETVIITPAPVVTVESTAKPTPVVTIVPTATSTPVVTIVPTATPTPVVTIVPTETRIPVITAVPTKVPENNNCLFCVYTEKSKLEKCYYYNEKQHIERSVLIPTCVYCGKEKEKRINEKYFDHLFENGVCIGCKWIKNNVSEENKVFAINRIKELENILELVKTAMKNGDVLDVDADKAIRAISQKIYNYKEVQNGTRELATIKESIIVDYDKRLEAEKLIIKSDIGKNIPGVYLIAYYQIVNGLEVTGWITQETYNCAKKTIQIKTEVSNYLQNVDKLSAEKLVDLIGSGIAFIQENKDNKDACDKAYAEIEILVRNLKKTPEYLNNRNLKDVDWIFKVGDNTPGFKDLVDLAFSKENI